MMLENMGTYILALRKSAGLTQQELASQLGVTNKSVSRWENGECAPDLTLIPVLGDIFGVTADELMRGERRTPEDKAEAAGAKEKRIAALSSAAVSRSQRAALLTAAASLLGIIALLTIAHGARLPLLGVGVCAMFAAAGAVAAIASAMRALQSLSGTELEGEAVFSARKSVLKCACIPCCISITAIFLSVPYLLPDMYYEYINAVLDFTSWLAMAPMCLAASAVVCAAALAIVHARVSKGHIAETGAQRCAASKRRAASLAVCAAVMAALLPLCLAISPLMGPKGTTFADFESFRTFIETPVNCTEYHTVYTADGAKVVYGETEYIEGAAGGETVLPPRKYGRCVRGDVGFPDRSAGDGIYTAAALG